MSKQLKSLSVFFPCFNDGRTIPELVQKIYKLISQVASVFEVIIIDDGSKTPTLTVLKNLKKKYPRLKIVYHKKNLGYGAALTSGFKSAKKEWVFYTDGDGQYDPSELTLLIDKAVRDVDVVNGYKLSRGDTIARKIVGILYNRILHLLYPLPIKDVDCDFRLIRKKYLDKIKLTSASGVLPLELVLKLRHTGARFTEVGVHHYKRRFGKSEFFKLKNILHTLWESIKFYLAYTRLKGKIV